MPGYPSRRDGARAVKASDGYTPVIFVALLASKRTTNAPGAAMRAGTDTNEPARMK